MRIPALHSAMPSAKLPFWGACLVMATLVTTSLSARPTRGKPPAPSLPPPEINRNASRFILPENQSAFVEKMLAGLSMTKRQFDPFGRAQDPDAAPLVVATPNPARQRLTSLAQKVSLQQVVSLLKISTIVPNEKRFMIKGGSSFKVGDIIPLTYRTKTIQAEVISVTSSQIHFRDPQSGETATLEMKLLPPGMQPGTTISEAPGLFRSDKQAPINLDAP